MPMSASLTNPTRSALAAFSSLVLVMFSQVVGCSLNARQEADRKRVEALEEQVRQLRAEVDRKGGMNAVPAPP